MPNKNCHEIDPKAAAEFYVVECDHCGFHLGLDVTYLRIADITVPCPACKKTLFIEEIE